MSIKKANYQANSAPSGAGNLAWSTTMTVAYVSANTGFCSTASTDIPAGTYCLSILSDTSAASIYADVLTPNRAVSLGTTGGNQSTYFYTPDKITGIEVSSSPSAGSTNTVNVFLYSVPGV